MLPLLLFAFSLLEFSPQTNAIFLPYWSKRNHSDTAFHIPFNALELEVPKRKSQKMQYYTDLAKNFSLDYRCEKGLAVSIAWHTYSPYTNIYQPKNKRIPGLTVDGMFSGILKAALSSCCHKDTKVLFGKLLKSVRNAENHIEDDTFDLTFPLYGYDSSASSFRDRAFIGVVTAPRVILLAHNEQQDKTRTHILISTIANAWPMLVFILVTASLSGIIIWFLDHTSNPGEFPPPFLRGSWEGFWWALVTMTTVGYGDRSPKSVLGRVFCILWIITGVIIVSIFTALVTASLSASTVQVFKIHGSKIGAVNGSEEFKLGVTMNADMKVFPHVMKLTQALLAHEIDGALVDNYVLTHSLNLIQEAPIRVERYVDHQITYGVVLAKNSSKLEKCVRKFLRNHPQEVFEIIASNLVPLKNPTDDENQQLKAAEELFYQEEIFEVVMYVGLGVAVAFFLIGILWEFICRRPKLRNQRMQFAPTGTYSINDDEVKLHPCDNSSRDKLDDMIAEYQLFHDRWIEGLKKLRDKESAADGASKRCIDGNGNADMVSV
ncbi:uncharacterized protein [Montipora capricornis]|uniref:uncharacterized protein n=1 Tax=Montipora capricornis TaxID=246305 RepID=UPI0035F172E5